MCSTLGKAHTLNSRITEGRALKQLYVFGRVGRAKLSSQKPRVGGFARPPTEAAAASKNSARMHLSATAECSTSLFSANKMLP